MSVEHNFMAHEVSLTLLHQLRSGEATACWRSTTALRTRSWTTSSTTTSSISWGGEQYVKLVPP